ncbi:ATP-binding cassette domain-containing protein [Castellaniella sp.]|uniref:branched-chain amino acid ABC transporter ATP-binding protein/permease n=1 Tax=Castellaniella sp. TaxID=1955812 RepID=UPI00355CF997
MDTHRTGFLVTAVVVGLLIATLSTYHVGVLTIAGTNILVCIGLGFLLAAGQLSLGHVAFVGLGAYGSAILARDYGVDPVLAIFVTLLANLVLAYVIGRLTLHLRGHYLPLATLAWGIAIYVCFVAAIDVTGGASGLSGIPALKIFGVEQGVRGMSALTWLLVGLTYLAFCRIYQGRIGRGARAIKSAPMMAAAVGVDVARVKIRIFVLSAGLAALSGGLYVFYMRFVSPSSFGIFESFNLLIMVVLGGYAHPLGAVLGVIAFTLIELGAQYVFANLLGIPGQMETILFGFILIVALLRWPQGLLTWMNPRYLSRRGKASGSDSTAALPAAQRAEGDTLLATQAVGKRFGGLQALRDVSIEVPAGRITGLIGPNGAGKSTLFNVLTSVFPPSDGQVVLDGATMPAQAHRVIRQGVARTFQHVQLVRELDVLDNVMLGGHVTGRAGLFAAAFGLDRQEEARLRSAAHAALTQVGLDDQALRPVGSLPLGSQRLVEVARALMSGPRILLLDEPAAGLRGPEKETLIGLMQRLRDEQGMAVLLVEHDMDLVMRCVDYLFVLNYGQLLAEGTRRDVQQNPLVIAAYLGE